MADIWESEQDLNSYINNKLNPAMEKINAPLPKEKIFSIHNVKIARNQTMIKTKIS
ncbi:MAG: hypothetical protein WAM88_12495 [Nitrososphaeraceae archaeon]